MSTAVCNVLERTCNVAAGFGIFAYFFTLMRANTRPNTSVSTERSAGIVIFLTSLSA